MMKFLATLKGKMILVGLGVILVAGGIVTVLVLAGPKDYRSIKVDELNGQTVITDSEDTVRDAYKGMNLKSGDVVTVQEDANMTLLLDMDKYMFADAGTKFTVEASGNSEKSNTKTRIILEEGSVLCRLDSKLGDEESFEVETPNSVMSVRGTIFKMTIYKDENGDNYAKVDVLEGSVKVDLYNENGEKTGEEGLIEAGQAATVHSNTTISEFVIGESDISYDDFSGPMASFVVETVDTGREICIGEDLFKHYTGLENHPEEGTVIKEPTCSEEGEKEIYCSTCDTVVRVEPVEKLPHTPGEWMVETNATCVERLRCSVCNEIIEEREIDFDKHDLERETIENQNGCDVHIVVQDVCKNCNITQEVSSRDEKRHTFGEWQITTEATCETAGGRQRTCSVCGEVETEEVAATGHSYSVTSTVAATCTAGGSSTSTCSNCGNQTTTSTAATGHVIVYSHENFALGTQYYTFTMTYQGKCSVCGVVLSTTTHSGTGSGTAANCECGHSFYYSW